MISEKVNLSENQIRVIKHLHEFHKNNPQMVFKWISHVNGQAVFFKYNDLIGWYDSLAIQKYVWKEYVPLLNKIYKAWIS